MNNNPLITSDEPGFAREFLLKSYSLVLLVRPVNYYGVPFRRFIDGQHQPDRTNLPRRNFGPG